MAYRLKTVKYKGRDVRILLQNENGPCPLLAAANALLLRDNISLPSHCIRNSVASLEDLTNMLANHAMAMLSTQHHSQSRRSQQQSRKNQQSTTNSSSSENNDNTDNNDDDHEDVDDGGVAHYVDELLIHIPKFQYGMDVNPTFTQGITGYEYTGQLTAFDLLRVKLVHGWLVDPQEHSEVYDTIGNHTYNALVEKVIHGNEASSELEHVQHDIVDLQGRLNQLDSQTDLLDDQDPNAEERTQINAQIQQLQTKCQELRDVATQGSLIHDFLIHTGHQLTLYGLQVLYEEIQNDELTVFFRNNHFATLTKHDGILYLLVTDLGYANTPNIVWEKLDVIDGDTEYVNSDFTHSGIQQNELSTGPTLTPDQLLAQSSQKDADFQLALHLSRQQANHTNIANGSGGGNGTTSATAAGGGNTSGPSTGNSTSSLDVQEGQLMAAATEASLRSYHGLSDGISTTNTNTCAASTGSPSAIKTPTGPGVVAVGIPLGTNYEPHSGTVAQLPPRPGGSDPNPTSTTTTTTTTQQSTATALSREEADRILAMQFAAENSQNYEDASLALARQLQDEENRRAAAASQQQQQPPQRATTNATTRATTTASEKSNCVIS